MRGSPPRHGRRAITHFSRTNLKLLAGVAILALVAAALLVLTLVAALAINSRASRIASAGYGIQHSTATIVLLEKTNRLARRILVSTRPLKGELSGIIGRAGGIQSNAQSIDATAGNIQASAASIDSSARAINGTVYAIDTDAASINGSAVRVNGLVGSIDSTAARIDGLAGAILGTAGTINTRVAGVRTPVSALVPVTVRIRHDVEQINRNADVTIALARSIHSDTGNILDEAHGTRGAAACIDEKLNGGADPDCPSG